MFRVGCERPNYPFIEDAVEKAVELGECVTDAVTGEIVMEYDEAVDWLENWHAELEYAYWNC